ncbi:MAG: methyltransferase domain-containing protein, partial [Planctomycetales bacterium]|nr:methyltransferase domain-containing protein [Planctomycetales bacterium]
SYDQFRHDYLRGRNAIVSRIGIGNGAHWADFGCGTGHLLQEAGDAAKKCGRITLIDLCPSLLRIAERRVKSLGLDNVELLEADVTTLHDLGELDCVTMSYSLSMIPNWYSAIDLAHASLKPGGRIGVADFFIAKKYPDPPLPTQGWLSRNFWPACFGWDNVWPNPDHIPYLSSKFHIEWFQRGRTKIPGLPFLRPPYYQLIGVRK